MIQPPNYRIKMPDTAPKTVQVDADGRVMMAPLSDTDVQRIAVAVADELERRSHDGVEPYDADVEMRSTYP